MKVDIWRTIALKPVRMTPTSITGSVHKEVITGGTINHVHHLKKVIRTSISNQPSWIDLVLGQAQINKYLIKNIASNNKILENINANLEGLTSCFTNQLSLNKMFEIQLAQLAAIILAYHFENISGQSKILFEIVNMVITRDGKSTRDLPYPNHAGKAKKHRGTTLNNRL